MNYLLKLIPNRVRRNYMGGAGIDWLHGLENGTDGNRPEEWVASMVEARNPGMEAVEGEGYGACAAGGKAVLVKDLVAGDPEFYFGKEHAAKKGRDPGFLFKILDSSMRLHVQAHPTAEFSKARLGSSYGKLECYYILHVRDGAEPYIRLGFQHAPERGEWKRIIEEQDIPAMDACFEKIPVEEGQIWFIPGGLPHAIGEGILMLEIMEPSDWVVRCEFEREGAVVPPDARFMGRGLEFCLDVFDYTQYSAAEIAEKSRLQPYVLQEGEDYCLEQLADSRVTSCFEVRRLRVRTGGMTLTGGMLMAGVVTEGTVILTCGSHGGLPAGGGDEVVLARGDSVMIAAAAHEIQITSAGAEWAEICLVNPSK